jgi:hypothetical protein
MTGDTLPSSSPGILRAPFAPAPRTPSPSARKPVLLRRLLSFLPALCLPAAFAAHPLQTEDTGTQGAGNVEIENGFARASSAGATQSLFQPQVSLGLAPTFDLMVQPSRVWARAAGRGAVAGWGDSNLDAKWRFWGRDPWSLAVRAGIEVPTSQHGLGLSHGGTGQHALLVLTWDGTPTTVHANVGATHLPDAPGTRSTTAVVSAAVMQTIDERLILTVDSQFNQATDAARHGWPGTVLGAAIWTARPGLDLDLGWQSSLHAAPVTRQWMAGLTWRFAL